ncbi:MAG: 4a-hydroxytetrahydrobiopterin dehydratase [Deltaproteobacteria bacterium]|nr:4a-hydroxytetrahydrobiopterin dehydratase [Deltaproteobacteria bacterium]
MAPALLSDAELAHLLAGLPGWTARGGALERTARTRDFTVAVELLGRVARVAVAQDHHPDLTVTGAALVIRVSTHDAGGVTQRDVALARAVEPLLAAVEP